MLAGANEANATVGGSLDAVQWRFNSQTPTPTSAAVPVAGMVEQGLK